MSSKEPNYYNLRLGKYWLRSPIKSNALVKSNALGYELYLTTDANEAMRASAPVAKELISEIGCVAYLIFTKPVADSTVEQDFETNFKGDRHDN